VSFLAWLEDELIVKKRDDLTEYSCAVELNNRRFQVENNKGLSFNTVSANGPNSASIHYMPSPKKTAKMNADLIYLLDSGG